jgi:dihydroxyacetone kinase
VYRFVVLKIVGAASENGDDLERCVALAQNVNAHLVTIGASLNHCHTPGGKEAPMLAADEMEFGSGVHNEPVG